MKVNNKLGLLLEYYKIMKPYFKKSSHKQILAIFCALINIISVIIYTWTLKYIIDEALLKHNIKILVNITILYIILVIIAYLSNIFKTYLFTSINQSILIKMRSKLYSHILR